MGTPTPTPQPSKDRAKQLVDDMLKHMTKEDLANFLTTRKKYNFARLLDDKEKIAVYRQEPWTYAKEIYNYDFTPAQKEIAESVRDNRFTVAQAHHSLGKSSIAGMLANWWYDCWPQHIVMITGPNWDQAKARVFGEVRAKRLEAGLVPDYGEILDIEVRDMDPLRRIFHYIKAINSKSSEGITGEHSAPVLFIIEEAVGVPHHIWVAAMSLMTMRECRILAIGNPTDEGSDFGIKANSSNWTVLAFSALDHPNLKWELSTGYKLADPNNPGGDLGPVPKAVSLDWLITMMEDGAHPIRDRSERMEDEFWFVDINELKRVAEERTPADIDPEAYENGFQGPGKNLILYKPSPDFQSRVLGVFPSASERQVIPKAWLKALLPQIVPNDPAIPVEIGVDVARYGLDRTTIFARRGPCVLSAKVTRLQDNVEVAEEIKSVADRVGWQQGVDPKKIPLKIDTTGNMGTGPHDVLRSWGYTVYGINSSTSAFNKETYPNRRSELWFAMRERVKLGALDLSRLDTIMRTEVEKELGIPQYKNDMHGRKVVEEKDQMRKRTEDGKSPDLADGLNLAFAGFDKKGNEARQKFKEMFWDD